MYFQNNFKKKQEYISIQCLYNIVKEAKEEYNCIRPLHYAVKSTNTIFIHKLDGN